MIGLCREYHCRVHIVHLTTEGESVIKKAFAHHQREMEHLISDLPIQERATLIALLKKLGKSVDSRLQSCRKGKHLD